MKILFIEPEKAPKTIETEDTLSKLQALVGGSIEVVEPFPDNVCLVCNEEGKINNMLLNRIVGDDIIAGPFFITGLADGDFVSLTEDQIRRYGERFKYLETFVREQDGILCIRHE